MVKMKILFITSIILFSFKSNSQNIIRIIPEIIEYKKVDTISLDLHIYRPLNFNNSKKYKTIIFEADSFPFSFISPYGRGRCWDPLP